MSEIGYLVLGIILTLIAVWGYKKIKESEDKSQKIRKELIKQLTKEQLLKLREIGIYL